MPQPDPTYEETIVFQSGAEYFTFRIPSIIEAPNGDLIAFAEGVNLYETKAISTSS